MTGERRGSGREHAPTPSVATWLDAKIEHAPTPFIRRLEIGIKRAVQAGRLTDESERKQNAALAGAVSQFKGGKAVSISTIQSIRSGTNRDPRQTTLLGLSTALGITMDWLANGDEEGGDHSERVLADRGRRLENAGFGDVDVRAIEQLSTSQADVIRKLIREMTGQ